MGPLVSKMVFASLRHQPKILIYWLLNTAMSSIGIVESRNRESTEVPVQTKQYANVHQEATHRLARGASVYVVTLAVGKGLTILLQVVLGRWLGPISYGLYSLGYSMVSLLFWLAVLGVDQGVLRYCAIYRTQGQLRKVRATLWRALSLAGVASILTAALLVIGSRWIAGHFFTPSFSNILAGFAVTLPLAAFIRIVGTYLQSLHDIWRMSVLQLLSQPVVNAVMLVLAISMGWGLYGAVGAYFLCCLFTAGLAAYYLLAKMPEKPVGKAPAFSQHPPLMRYSAALMFSGLSYQTILRAPQILLGYMGNSGQVGIYTAGASFALAFAFMTSTFLQPAMPMMVELYETKQSEGLRRLYQNATRWTLAVVMPIFLLLSLFNSEVMKLFGRNFTAAGPILLAMSLGWLTYYGKGPGSSLLQMTGRQNLDLANTLGAAVLTVVMNCLAIPRYGVIGAAGATAGSIAVWAVVEYVEVWLLYGILPWSSGAQRNVLGALITATVTLSLRSMLPWQILLFGTSCIYSLIYFGLCLEPDDRRIIGIAMARLKGVLGLSHSRTEFSK